MRRISALLGLTLGLVGLTACIPIVQGPPPGGYLGLEGRSPASAPADNPPPRVPANGVELRLTDGSRGLGLWCQAASDCIADARYACNGRQSIRLSSDIDRNAPGAATFFARAQSEPATLVVACS